MAKKRLKRSAKCLLGLLGYVAIAALFKQNAHSYEIGLSYLYLAGFWIINF